MSRMFDCTDATQREEGLRTATAALGRGALVVLPTDTVYGVAADAFNPGAVQALLAAKGRGRAMPPPVLISGTNVLAALVDEVRDDVRALAEAFWPGGLTIICWAQPSLAWDLGDTGGTVAVRVPDHPLTRDLLTQCGPLATSSANLTGQPVAGTAEQAQNQLGTAVEVYLEIGEIDPDQSEPVPSTIVDATAEVPRVVRLGAISLEQLRAVVPGLLSESGEAPAPETSAAPSTENTQNTQSTQNTENTADNSGTYNARAAFAARLGQHGDPPADQ